MAKRTAGARRGLSGMSVMELHRELRKRERSVAKLSKKRDALLRKLSALDQELAAAGALGRSGRGGYGVRKRPKNELNLVEALQKTLSGKTMSVTDVSEQVQKDGYRTTSPSFRTIVNQTLINSGKFKRVSRGQYTAK